MVKFVCKHCKFRFEAADAFDCPYCGRETIEKEKSAGELLEDVDKILQQ
ncbi:MAG: hypothetical protein WCX73_02500 [Candidatus Pacearchaeota archaeon]|jgi:DNA-directed RNA polymerase subunit RPC12/RpoP